LNNIKKSDVSRGENTRKKMGQMSSKYGEIIKKLISVFGEKPARGLPKPPPTPPLYTWRKCDFRTRTRNPAAELRRGEKGRGEKNNANLNNSITK
jgi:hypothetical protein